MVKDLAEMIIEKKFEEDAEKRKKENEELVEDFNHEIEFLRFAQKFDELTEDAEEKIEDPEKGKKLVKEIKELLKESEDLIEELGILDEMLI